MKAFVKTAAVCGVLIASSVRAELNFECASALGESVQAVVVSDLLSPQQTSALAEQSGRLAAILPALAVWRQGVNLRQTASKTRVKASKKALAELIQLQDQLNEQATASATEKLLVNVLLSRVYLVESKWVRAVKTANKALRITTKTSTGLDPNLMLFANGLRELYGAQLEELPFIARKLLAFKGDKKTGISLLEQVASGGSALAPEAARTLLMEVEWAYPRVCGYLDWAQQLQQSSDDLDYVGINMALLLSCGYPEKAARLSATNLKSSTLSDQDQAMLQRYLARAKADLGTLKATEVESAAFIESLAYTLLAYSSDVGQQRDQAKAYYQRVIESKSASKQHKRIAAVRLDKPYKPKKKMLVKQVVKADSCF